MNKKKFLLTIVLYSSFLLILFIFLIELFLYLSENRVDEKTMTVSLEPTLAPILPPPTIKPLSGPISSPTTIPSPTSNASSRRNKTLPSYIPKNLHKTIVIVCTGGDGYLSHCFFKNSKILESNNSTWHFYPSEDFVSLGNLDCFDWPFIEVGQCNGPPDREATFLLTMPDGNSVELPRYSYSDDDYIYTRYDFGSESQLGTYVISVHSRYGIFRKEFVVQNSDNANGVRFLNCKTKVDCEIKKKNRKFSTI